MKNQIKKISILMLSIGIIIACSKKEDVIITPKNTFVLDGKSYTITDASKYQSSFSCTKKDLYIYAKSGNESIGFFIYNLPNYEGNFSFVTGNCNLRSSGTDPSSVIIDSQSNGTLTISESSKTFSITKSNFAYRATGKVITVEVNGTFN